MSNNWTPRRTRKDSKDSKSDSDPRTSDHQNQKDSDPRTMTKNQKIRVFKMEKKRNSAKNGIGQRIRFSKTESVRALCGRCAACAAGARPVRPVRGLCGRCAACAVGARILFSKTESVRALSGRCAACPVGARVVFFGTKSKINRAQKHFSEGKRNRWTGNRGHNQSTGSTH
jgi:hypothetical protein